MTERTISSILTGNQPYKVTQEFGVNEPGVPDEWYAYAADWGWPYGTHVGIDIGTEMLTDIYAVADGIVTQVGMSEWFRPKPVWVRTDDGEVHIYGHMWTNAVSAGERVRKGDYLGQSGQQTYVGTMTSDGSGPHIHFERRDEGRQLALDPEPLLRSGAIAKTPGGTKAVLDPRTGLLTITTEPESDEKSIGQKTADLIVSPIRLYDEHAPKAYRRALLFGVGVVLLGVALWRVSGGGAWGKAGRIAKAGLTATNKRPTQKAGT